MSENLSTPAVHAQLAPDFSLLKIPPRPALLMALQHEMRQASPNTKKFANLIRRDVAMSGTLLQTANSAYFNLGRKISTVEDAIILIGLDHCNAIMSGLILKRTLGLGNKMMARFWDVSEKRAIGISFLARGSRTLSSEVAYSFGLFCDAGIPILKAAFPGYLDTLAIANRKATKEAIEMEDSQHGVNHTLVGALLAERWSISPDVVLAIRMHHTRDALRDPSVSPAVRSLIALNYLVEKAIQEYRGQAESLEWMDAGALASDALHISEADVGNICEALVKRFKA